MSVGKQQRADAGGTPPASSTNKPAPGGAGLPAASEKSQREDKKKMMPAYGSRTQTQPMEGIAVVGEALRRVAPESAEFLIEITAAGATGSQAIQNHQTKTTQIAQAVSTLGVQRADLQTVSMNVVNAYANGYAPLIQALPQYGLPQVGQGGLSAFAASPALQPELQFGATHQARSVLRVSVRDAARAGEIADALVTTGAN